jgi:homoserine O-acetyltransferase
LCLQLPLTFAQEAATTKAAEPDPLVTAESDYILKDFHFMDGESLPELKLHELMTSNAARLQQELGSVEQVNAWLESVGELCRSGQIDANDLVHRFEASADYDPSPGLEKIQAPVLAINFADDELNPPELGILDRAKPRIRNGQFVLIPASSQTQGHMTLRKASIYAPFVADFLAKYPMAR